MIQVEGRVVDCLAGRRTAPRNQGFGPMAHEAAHFLHGDGPALKPRENMVGGQHEVGSRIHQGSVQVEDHRLKCHVFPTNLACLSSPEPCAITPPT